MSSDSNCNDDVSSLGTSKAESDSWEDIPSEDGNSQLVVDLPPAILRIELKPAPLSEGACERSLTEASVSNSNVAVQKDDCVSEQWSGSTISNEKQSRRDNVSATLDDNGRVSPCIQHFCELNIQSQKDESSSSACGIVTTISNEDKCSTTESALANGFECLDINGCVALQCKRCTLFNDCTNRVPVCVGCGLALSANPSIELDGQLAKQLQSQEDKSAFAAVVKDERKRTHLPDMKPIDNVRVLVEDYQTIIAKHSPHGDLRVMSEVDVTMHTSQMIGAYEKRQGTNEVKTGFCFTPRQGESNENIFDTIRLRGFPVEAMKWASRPDVTFQSAVKDAILQMKEHVTLQETDYLGWIVVVDPLQSKCYPIVAFVADIRNSAFVQQLFVELSTACRDFLLTDWVASCGFLLEEPASKKIKLVSEIDNTGRMLLGAEGTNTTGGSESLAWPTLPLDTLTWHSSDELMSEIVDAGHLLTSGEETNTTGGFELLPPRSADPMDT